MAHTDRDRPLRLRKDEPDFSWRETTNRERLVGIGQGGTKRLKRASSKKNRRRAIPHTSHRGYGWGADNYRYAYSD